MRGTTIVLALGALIPAPLHGQDAPGFTGWTPPEAIAVHVDVAPQIDGRLDDAVWALATPVTQFTQRDPEEGEPASERTQVRILYDREALYVGARLEDRHAVTSRLGRRDMQNGASDWFRLSLDSFRDRRTAFRFEVNPSGVKRDAVIVGGFTSGGTGGAGGGGGGSSTTFTGGEGDLAWDAVWDAATLVDERGWSVEIRIPFSQLRFSPTHDQVWGIQLERIIDRRQEISLFAFVPKSEQGGVATFGALRGLSGVRPARRLELIPYLVTHGRFAEAGSNPLRRDREVDLDGGVDARYRVTSNLTLAATVNPDFGQVEVDPAVINLTAFETRYQEKRPFFVEGATSFRFAGSVMFMAPNAAATLLYSRRIGRAPQLALPGLGDAPATARILGAGKLTGNLGGGWSIGALSAVTNREVGRYMASDGSVARAAVEPLSHHFAGRASREMRDGASSVGGMITAVNRHLEGPSERILHSSAYAGGADFGHEWANRSWYVGGFLAASQVAGGTEAILRTQTGPARYLQRPDSERLRLDPLATSLSGAAAVLQFRKQAGTHWTGDWSLSTITPGYEINDLGFQQRADRHHTSGGIRYTERRPGRFLRTWNLHGAGELHWNYDGDFIDGRFWTTLQAQHLNYWRLSTTLRREPERLDDRLTRGGPLARRPATTVVQSTLNSDPRRSVGAALTYARQADEAGGHRSEAALTLDVRTSPRWNLSLGPELSRTRLDAQYVAAVNDPVMSATYGRRYVFAPLEQTELSLVTRLNYTFTPNMTLELYAQPLIAHAEYGAPKQFQRPSAYEFATFGDEIGSIVREGSSFRVSPGDGGAEFRIPDRSFTTRSVRGNAVLRWEYRPGSTFYAVWQQERLNPLLMDDFALDRALGSLFEGHANNVLVLKWSYWFNP